MATDIIMPKLSLTMTEGIIVEWKKNVGDPIHKGETLFIIETDKVTLGVEADEDGILTQILIPEGELVPIETVVACMDVQLPQKQEESKTASQNLIIVSED